MNFVRSVGYRSDQGCLVKGGIRLLGLDPKKLMVNASIGLANALHVLILPISGTLQSTIFRNFLTDWIPEFLFAYILDVEKTQPS